MAAFSSTELDATIQEVWDQDVEEARYESGVVLNRVANKSAKAKYNDILRITYKAKYTTSAVTVATGAFTTQTITPTGTTVTLNQWKTVPIEVPYIMQDQSFWNPESDFPKDAGAAMGEDNDNYLLDLDSNFTSNDVNSAAAPTAFDDVAMLAAVLKLRDRAIPLNDLSFILPPIAFYKGIFTKPEFRDADKTGLPKSVLSTGYRMKFLEIPSYETTLVNTDNLARVGLLIHKTAMAIAFQRNNEIKRAEGIAAGKLSSIAVLHSLYGASAWRTDHASRIFITKD